MANKIKIKIINNLVHKGKKWTAEKILLKSFKELHKISSKQLTKIIKLFIIFTLFIFKSQEIEKKRWNNKIIQNFKIIKNSNCWIFLTIKFIWNCSKDPSSNYFFIKLYWKIFLNAKNSSTALNQKTILQNKISLKKKFFYYYKW